MHWLQSGALSVVAVVALAGAVTAQDEGMPTDPDLRAPASVAGTVSVVGPNQPTAATAGEPPLWSVQENYGWTLTIETDDPRLSGTYQTNQNAYRYGDIGSATVRAGIGCLTNEGGSWASEFRGFTPSPAPGIGNYYVTFFTGEGAYEGLSAMLWWEPGASTWAVQGVIVPGPWPEPPEWVLPPSE